MVSLAESADHAHHSLVGPAQPVTHHVYGDTMGLRTQLGLDKGPHVSHVIDHMLKMAAAGHLKAAMQLQPLHAALTDDVHGAYHIVIKSIDKMLKSGQTPVAWRLLHEPWVLVKTLTLSLHASSALTWRKTHRTVSHAASSLSRTSILHC